MQILKLLADNYKSFLFSIFSCLVAVYFIWAFHQHVEFPPTKDLTITSVAYLILFVFFIILPFSRRLKIGRILEFETKVKEMRQEVREVREETRQLISTVSTVANSMSSTISQTIQFGIPEKEEAEIAEEKLSEVITDPPEQRDHQRDIQALLSAGESDIHYALARLRIDMERELRRILRKHSEFCDPSSMQGSFLSVRSLFRMLVRAEPRYERMEYSLGYMLRVCNSAIHGQRVPEDVAYKAMDMGLRMLGELKKQAEL